MRIATLIPALALMLTLGAGAAYAQTGSTTYTTTNTSGATTATTPGTPNTGAGGDAAENAIMLTGTGLVALFGAAYLLRSRTR